MQEPEINLHGWQTIKAYAAEKGISTQVVSNRLKRGSHNLQVKVYPELNNLKLVKEK